MQTNQQINKRNILSVVVLTKGRKVCWVTRHVWCLAFPLVCYTRFRITWNYHKHFLPTWNYPTKSKKDWNQCALYIFVVQLTNNLKVPKIVRWLPRPAWHLVALLYTFPVLRLMQPETISQDWISGKTSYRRGRGLHAGVMAIKRFPFTYAWLWLTLVGVSALV